MVYSSASASDSDNLVATKRDGFASEIGRKWKSSDSSDSDSVELMTPLTTPCLVFTSHKRSSDCAYDKSDIL